MVNISLESTTSPCWVGQWQPAANQALNPGFGNQAQPDRAHESTVETIASALLLTALRGLQVPSRGPGLEPCPMHLTLRTESMILRHRLSVLLRLPSGWTRERSMR